MHAIPDSELIINPDGSIYHLHLRPEQIAETIITVGDPGRVPLVSKYFDQIEHQAQHREFITHTGKIGNKRLTVLSTGIGTDNIDIALNELDALANIDFNTRLPRTATRRLDIIRLGTSGALAREIEMDSIVLSGAAIGIDNLLHFYNRQPEEAELALAQAFNQHISRLLPEIKAYAALAHDRLLKQFSGIGESGVTLTAPGFYAPQGRQLRSVNKLPEFLPAIGSFTFEGHPILNLEMETSAIFALGKHLGHRCLSVNAILAHRLNGTFSADPAKTIEKMIRLAIDILIS